MPFSQQKAVQALMDEQAAQADTPENTAMLPEDEPEEIEQSPEPEPEQESAPTEPPLPAEAATDVPETGDFPEQENGSDPENELTVPEGDEAPERPEPEWEEMLTKFDDPEEPDTSDPYADAMADVDWKMRLQDRSQSLL